MKIEFTEFTKGENWVSGVVNYGEYVFESKLFDEGSVFGIDGSRVSKLSIRKGNSKGFFDFSNCIVNYDRGWDIEPKTDEENDVFEAVLEFLENAPKTRFS
jgi:hypothetical protein